MFPNQRCLILDIMHSSIHQMLQEAGIAYDYEPNLTQQQIGERIADYTGIIVRSKLFLDAAFFEQATTLQWVARAGAGTDNIDEVEAAKRGIQIFNAPEGNQDSVAEHTLALLLNLLNKISVADAQVRQGIWQRENNRGRELKGQTVGLIGFGHMGQATAKRLASFGCRVIAYDKYLKTWPDSAVEQVTFELLTQEADIVSLHIPLTEETRGWVDETFFATFAKNIYFLNTSRGKIVKLEALEKALFSGRVLGAGLDVLENEKLETLTTHQKDTFHRLAQSDKVLFTPHVAGWTVESHQRINTVLIQKIVAYLQQQSK